MEPNSTPDSQPADLIEQTAAVVNEIGGYGSLIVNSLYLIICGMVVIYLLYKLASKYLYPHMQNTRLIKVVFGTLYLLVLVITALLVLKKIGIDVEWIAPLVLVTVLIGSVVTFFLVPFFPRLPFKIGHMIEVNGALGYVDAITTFHTSIRKFDGTMAFIPNALLMASKILNFSDVPFRRIELKMSVNTDCDIEESKALFLRIMGEDERVLDDPSPPAVFVINVTAAGTDLFAFCWVKNEDWFSVRSDLWIRVVDAFLADERVAMSLPQQEVFVIDKPFQPSGTV